MSLILGDIQTAYYTSAQWSAWNGTLKAGQRGIESDTLKEKVGDGVTVWNSLSYLSAPNYDLQAVLTAGNSSGNLSAKFGTGTVYFGATNQTHITYNAGIELHNTTANKLVNLTDAGLWKVDAVQYMPNLTGSRLLSLDANKYIVNETGTGILTLTGGVISYDTNTYLTTGAAALTYQPLDSDLTSWAGVTRASGFDTFTATPSSANLSSLLTDKTGTGVNVFGTSPTFTTDITTPSIIGTGSITYNASGGNHIFQSFSTQVGVIATNAISFTPVASTSGITTAFSLTVGANTGQTATEIPNYKVTGNTKTWANGGGATTIATQRWNWFSANTAATSGGGSLTITNSFGLYAEAATASGVTITNSWAIGASGGLYVKGISGSIVSFLNSAGNSGFRISNATLQAEFYSGGTISTPAVTFNGATTYGLSYNLSQVGLVTNGVSVFTFGNSAVTLADAYNIALNGTTGTKIGTATTQKLSFWNATPIVQPTTAYSAASFTANAGTAVNDASTFDGYTLKQIVAALRGIGLLA